MSGISKRFGGVQALTDVSFEVRAGEVHALLGENGAGKSTLVKILAGAERPNAGSVMLDGVGHELHTPGEARRAGVSVVYQEFSLVPTLSVLENLFLGAELRQARGFIDWRAQRKRAIAVGDRMGVQLPLDRRVESLVIAEQQRVEIARALLHDSRVVVLDEPSAVLAGNELEQLFSIVRALRASGVGVVYISHRMAELAEIADRVTVLRDGRYIATKEMSETNESELIRLMVGRSIDAVSHDRQHFGPELLQLRHVRLFKGTPPISLEVQAGEVVGLAGLVGSGRTRLASILAGLHRPYSGEVTVAGEPFRFGSPRASIKAGLAVIPEDRRDEGACLSLSITRNVSIPNLRQVSRGGLVSASKETGLAMNVIQRLDVRPPKPAALVGRLSGGNQQKVVIGKSLVRDPAPSIFVFDEPTRGIDVLAKNEVHRTIAELAASGAAVILISSELPEVLKCSQRIVVMRDGGVAGELAGGASEEDVMSLAVGQAA